MEAAEQNYTETLRQKRLETKKGSTKQKKGKQGAKSKSKGAKKSIPFPLLLFLAALTKDTLDIIPFVGFVTTPIFWFVVFIWFINKDPVSQKVLSSRMLIGGGTSFAIGSIPIVNLVPETTIFVYSMYRREKKALKSGRAFLA